LEKPIIQVFAKFAASRLCLEPNGLKSFISGHRLDATTPSGIILQNDFNDDALSAAIKQKRRAIFIARRVMVPVPPTG
jgi:hypothetical protein